MVETRFESAQRSPQRFFRVRTVNGNGLSQGWGAYTLLSPTAFPWPRRRAAILTLPEPSIEDEAADRRLVNGDP